MLRVFSDRLMNPENFVVTIQLVPGRESFGAGTDTLVASPKMPLPTAGFPPYPSPITPAATLCCPRMFWDMKFSTMGWM
jgi:hypothetical protein